MASSSARAEVPRDHPRFVGGDVQRQVGAGLQAPPRELTVVSGGRARRRGDNAALDTRDYMLARLVALTRVPIVKIGKSDVKYS